jgi:general secretion pathway protein D
MRLVVSLLALISVAGAYPPLPALAQPAPAAASAIDKGVRRSITMDFQDVDIAALVKFISEVTGKDFVLDDRVHGKLTRLSPRPPHQTPRTTRTCSIPPAKLGLSV